MPPQFDQASATDILCIEIIHACDKVRACCLCDFLDIFLFNAFDSKDFRFCQEMLGYVLNSELAENYICPGGSDPVNHIMNDLLFLVKIVLEFAWSIDLYLGFEFLLAEFNWPRDK